MILLKALDNPKISNNLLASPDKQEILDLCLSFQLTQKIPNQPNFVG
ncbi:hypothetical protein TOTSKI_06630 [Facklamia hominis]